MLAAATPDPVAASLLLPGTLVVLFIGYLLGRAHAMWKRARADYVGAKRSVPVLRTTKWSQWWSLIKQAGIVAVVIAMLIVWLYAGVDGQTE